MNIVMKILKLTCQEQLSNRMSDSAPEKSEEGRGGKGQDVASEKERLQGART